MSWEDFERLVGEAFRHQGYQVSELGGSVPDGGVDLVVTRAGGRYFVQCKHWKVWSVGVKVVRELLGVIVSQGVDGGFVVTSGVFTKEARAFAAANRIELLDGAALQAMVAGEAEASAADGSALARSRQPLGMLASAVLGMGVVLGALTLLFATHRPQVPAGGRSVPSIRTMPTPASKPTLDPDFARAQRRRDLQRQFEAQYVAPKFCDNWQSDQQVVECGNHYIRAKKRFFAIHGQ